MESHGSFKHFAHSCKTLEFHSEIVFLVTCNTTKFLTPPFSLAKGKCGLGMGLSNPQLASFIHSFKIHYPSSWTWGASSGVRDSPDCAFAYPCVCLGIETDAKAEPDVSSVNFSYSQQVWFPWGACSSRKNDSQMLQLRGITECTSSSKLTQKQKLNGVWLLIVLTAFIFSCKHKMLCHSLSDTP